MNIRNFFSNINPYFVLLPAFSIGTALVFYGFWLSPYLTEVFYLRGFFQIFRVLHDYSFGLLPVATIYLLFASLVLGFSYYLYLSLRQPFSWTSILRFLGYVVLFFLTTISLFYILWAYNYAIPNDQVAYQSHDIHLSESYIYKEITSVQEKITKLRDSITPSDTSALDGKFFNNQIEDEIRVSQEQILKSWDWPTFGRVRVRLLRPEGMLLRLSTAGVYIPFALEGHIDAGLFHLQYPFTMAHEMAHGYGFTDEGFCNFVGFVTCINTRNDYIQYSAWLNYWRYLMNDLRKINRDDFYCQIEELPLSIRKDLNAIHEYQDRFPDLIPVARDRIYDAYLKSNGVKKGLISYSEMTKMVYLWKSQHPDLELIKMNF